MLGESKGLYVCGRMMGDIVNLGQRTKYGKVDLKNLRVVQKLLENYDMTMRNFEKIYPDLEYKKYTIEVNKNTSLDSIKIIKKSERNNGVYMVMFNGRGEIFEGRIRDYCEKSKTYNCNVIGFNYRGVSKSVGKATRIKDLIDDGVAQVERLIDEGVSPSRILLTGECMGAAIATGVAARLHRMNEKVYLFNDRGFYSLSKMVNGVVDLNYAQKGQKRKGKILKKIVTPFISGGLKISGWDIDVLKCYNQIPSKYKEYIVVRSTREERKKSFMFDDGLIKHNTSLHMALKKKRREEKKIIADKLRSIEENNKVPEKTKKRLIKRFNNDLSRHKERKMQASSNLNRENYVRLFKNEALIHACDFIKNEIEKLYKLEDQVYMVQLAKFYNLGKNENVEKLLNKMGINDDKEIRQAINSQDKIKWTDYYYNLENELKAMESFKKKAIVNVYGKKGLSIITMYEGMKKTLINELFSIEKKLLNSNDINIDEVLDIDVRGTGLAKMGHFKKLTDLKSQKNGLSGEDFLRNFIKRMKRDELIMKENLK